MKPNKHAQRSARRLFRLCFVHGMLDEDRARQVVQRTVRSGRRGTLAVLSDFGRRVRLERARRTAVVESAAPLAGSVREGIQADLARVYGPGLATSFGQDPALIGGMRIKVGSDVYDGSVRARLAALAARL